MNYLESNYLFHRNHHAYRSNHNTTTALIQVYDACVTAQDQGNLSGLYLLDMSAAFHIVDHEILLQKRGHYRFDTESKL